MIIFQDFLVYSHVIKRNRYHLYLILSRKKIHCAFRSIIQFSERFLADLISIRATDFQDDIFNKCRRVYVPLCASRTRDPLTFTPPLGGAVFTLGRTYHVRCGFTVYSRVRTDRESRRKRETKGSKGKSMGICYPRYCFSRERAEGGSFRYGNIN